MTGNAPDDRLEAGGGRRAIMVKVQTQCGACTGGSEASTT